MIKIYKASAGSGKTHTLTKDFLLLVFENWSNYRKILAVTFTNKAAGEMKQRIIEELTILSKTPTESSFLTEIKNRFSYSEELLSLKAAQILKKILHNYSFFSISTIDSFIQKVIRAFVFELNIPVSYKLELDGEKVSNDLTDSLLSNLEEDKNLQRWLMMYAFERISQGQKWNFRQNIIEFSKQLFNEKFYDLVENQSNFTEKFEDLSNKINTEIKKYEIRISELNDKAIQIIKNSGIDSVKSQKIKYLRNFFYKNDEKISIEINNTLQKAINDNDYWNKTTKESEKTQWYSTINSLHEIILKILELDGTEGKKYRTALKIKSNLYSFGVINNLKNKLPEYREENNIMLIIDLTLLLNKIISDNETPFIYEKIGNRYNHIMIDEFQDTSTYQWRNFKPLIINTLSSGNYNLIVGDVKQSIYRWRNGDWRLLFSGVKEQIGTEQIDETNLDTNWRSKDKIVRFNNSLFHFLSKDIQEKANNDLRDNDLDSELRSLLPSVYSDIAQNVASHKSQGGYVKMEFVISERGYEEMIKQKVLDLISDLLKKYSPGDIAILVRRNSEANDFMRLILDYSSNLPSELQFNVVSAESLLLTNSMAVNLIVDVFNYIFSAQENIYLLNIIANYLRLSDRAMINFHSIQSLEDAKDMLPKAFIEIFDELSRYSIFELTEKIISIFNINKLKNELPFVRSFEEVVADIVKTKGSDLKVFISFWNDNKHKFSVQLSEVKDAMQIMTLHKSKGLAFRVVIMPYINWKLEPTRSVIWVNSSNSTFNDFNFLPIDVSKDMLDTEFSEAYISEKMYSYMDAINMLYVAFTRSADSLYGFLPVPKQMKFNSISEYIYQVFDKASDSDTESYIHFKKYWNSEDKVFEFGDEITQLVYEADNEKDFVINNYPANDWTKNISIVSHNEDIIHDLIETRQEAIREGIQMHEIFAEIKTFEDVETAIKTAINNNKLSIKESENIRIKINNLFKNDKIKSWFDSKYFVQTEKEILTKYGTTKIPDRVISDEKEIIVIDYKFGGERPEHKKQVRNYMKLLENIEQNKSIYGYLLYADEEKIVDC